MDDSLNNSMGSTGDVVSEGRNQSTQKHNVDDDNGAMNESSLLDENVLDMDDREMEVSEQKKVDESPEGSGNEDSDLSSDEEENDIDNLLHNRKLYETNADENNQVVIWGTLLQQEKVSDQFHDFLFQFKTESKFARYKQLLNDLRTSQDKVLLLDCNDLHSFNKELYLNLILYPQEVISIMDSVLKTIMNNESMDNELNYEDFQVRPYNLKEVHHMRKLDPTHIDQLLCIRGMVTRVSEIIPDIVIGHFKCSICDFAQTITVKEGRIEEPSKCNNCGSAYSTQLIHNQSTYHNKQLVKIQETPESVPEGETPLTVNLCVFDLQVDIVKPGDRVDVTGIYRATSSRLNPSRRVIDSVYKTYIDVVHFKKSGIVFQSDEKEQEDMANQKDLVLQKNVNDRVNDSHDSSDNNSDISDYEDEDFENANKTKDHKLEDEDDNEDNFDSNEQDDEIYSSNVTITKEDEEMLEKLSKQPDIYDRLVKAIAPGIYEMDDVKKGVLLQLFGGVHKHIPNGKIRGELNILLVGDPGVSKSQILSHIHKIAPRGIYTSGKGSSAVGLTAYVTKDPDTGEFVLESGALVLSDLGVCCIDEFDKMSDATRSILHEVMEQQTVSVAKAGIICSLNARTSILAAANPKESRYNDSLSIVENIQLPPTLLSRFDLIFLMRDIPDIEKDGRLAKHIISLYHQDSILDDGNIDVKTLTKYIAYSKKKIRPAIVDAAREQLVDEYVKLRRMGTDRKQITATTRQLESLVRLSEAHARMRFSKYVTVEDVAEAVRLMRYSIFKACYDPNTGTVDMDMLQTGMTSKEREIKQKEHESLDENIIEDSFSQSSYTTTATNVINDGQGLSMSLSQQEFTSM